MSVTWEVPAPANERCAMMKVMAVMHSRHSQEVNHKIKECWNSTDFKLFRNIGTEGQKSSPFSAESEHWCGGIKSSLAPGCPKSRHAFLNQVPSGGRLSEDAFVGGSRKVSILELLSNFLS